MVNRDKIESFNRELITLKDVELPLSRKYKEEEIRSLSGIAFSGRKFKYS